MIGTSYWGPHFQIDLQTEGDTRGADNSEHWMTVHRADPIYDIGDRCTTFITNPMEQNGSSSPTLTWQIFFMEIEKPKKFLWRRHIKGLIPADEISKLRVYINGESRSLIAQYRALYTRWCCCPTISPQLEVWNVLNNLTYRNGRKLSYPYF